MVNTSSDEGSVDLMSSGNVENTPLVISYIYIYIHFIYDVPYIFHILFQVTSYSTESEDLGVSMETTLIRDTSAEDGSLASVVVCVDRESRV